MSNLPKKLQLKLTKRTEDGSLRELSKESRLVDFSSNDYLGFAKEKSFSNDVSKLLSQFENINNGATGSRLLTGNHPLYKKLELRLANLFKSDAALVFNSGYDANIGFFSSVPQRGDIVFYDEFIHASIRDGINLGNAKSIKFKHNDLKDLKFKYQNLVKRIGPIEESPIDIYLVTEAVFSMDGDSPDLFLFVEFCLKNQIRLIVDEAHSVGVFGEKGNGLVSQLGLENKVFARIITFGKAFGCHGAAVLGTSSLIEYLVNFARSFIYTTALAPHAIASIVVAIEFLNVQKGKKSRIQLQEKISFFNQEVQRMNLTSLFIQSNSSIHCALISGNECVKTLAEKLKEDGFDIKPILSPTIPAGKERIRFCIHSYNSKVEITRSLGILAKFM
ncbi:aminotransferase class I/II-fold pyridoxal phosphate-dependent enzyme [Kriegella sp. EG-1]|nr:aminotransferase class I/II-fold pyridoxal phosphate-dependent enzyme [Flavobacteriaceae bacterium EG-1]